MLRASMVEIVLTPDDLRQALESYAAGRAEGLQVDLGDRSVIVRHRVISDKLPMAVPVELRLTVREAHGTQVEAGVEWSNLSLLPGFLKELALQKAFEALPGTYENGVFRVDVADVLDNVPVSFRIASVQIAPDGMRVSLADVVAFPFEAAVVVEQPGALVPVPSQEEARIPEHQDFYQKLRAKVHKFTGEKAPRWAQPLVPWVLAVPDFFVLMVRLARDERVSPVAKVIAGATIAYLISPIDLIPDPIPIIGEVDDVALALFAVEQIAQRVDPAVVEEHWPGEGKVLELVKEGTLLFRRILPEKMLTAIRRILERK